MFTGTKRSYTCHIPGFPRDHGITHPTNHRPVKGIQWLCSLTDTLTTTDFPRTSLSYSLLLTAISTSKMSFTRPMTDSLE